MKANADLKALAAARDKANLFLEAARQRIKDLEVKKDALAGKGGSPAVEVSSAAAKKRGIIARFVLGDASKEELNSARTAFERARRNEEEAKEMIEAVDDAIEEARKELPALERGFSTAEDALWRGIAKDLKEEAVKLAGDLIAKAYAAEPSRIRFDFWVEDTFKSAGQVADGNASVLRQQIEQEYLAK